MKFLIHYCKSASRDHNKSKRQYAHTYHFEDENIICVARAIEEIDPLNYWAIVAHEIGHILGGYEASEEDADKVANKYFGIKIKYKDSKYGKRLQTVSLKEAEKIKSKLKRKLALVEFK